MRQKNRFAIWSAICLALAAFCMVGGMSAMEAALPDVRGRMLCRYGGDGPSFERINLLRDIMAEWAKNGQVMGAVTAWTQTSNTEIKCEATVASLELNALWIDGEANLIWSWEALTGSVPVYGTTRDCAIDADTAQLLFGSMNIIGQTVKVGNIAFTVACVFQLPQGLSSWGADPGCGLALLPASMLSDSSYAGPNELFDGNGGMKSTASGLDFNVTPRDGHTPKEWVETWLNESRISLPEWGNDLWQQRRLLSTAAQCGPMMIVACVVMTVGAAALRLLRAAIAGARACWLDRLMPTVRGWRLLGIGVAGTAALTALGLWAAGLPRIVLDIPADFLPTRWSDLSFWPNLALNQVREQASRQMLGALRPDMIRDHLAGLSANLSLLAVPMLFLSWRGMRKSTSASWILPKILIPMASVLVSLPLALWCVRRLGWPASITSGLLPLALVFAMVAQLPAAYPLMKMLMSYHQKNNHEEVSL